jgi:hypothetical protein
VREEATGRPSGRRVTVDEAARHLGLTVDAVRKRVQRDQIAHEKDAAGRVRIILDNSETLRDESPDTTGPASELVEELRDRVRYLERQLEGADERDRENRRIIAMLTSRIPAIEAPREEPPESPEPRPGTPTPTEAGGGPQEGSQRPWWQRWFGG